MEKDRALNILQNAMLLQVHGAWHEALKMAIDAFKAEPCEDAISRKAAIECFEMTNTRPGAKHAIETLPSVQPKHRTGHWIKKMVRGSEELYCSNCGDGIDVIYEYNYCPTCGAKMEEGE